MFLPFPYIARNDTKEGMGLRGGDFAKLPCNQGCSHSQFCPEVFPFIEQLAARFLYLRAASLTRDLPGIELVAATRCLLCQAGEKRCDDRERFRMRLKPHKLWMMPVAPGGAREHLLREQRLTPRRYQSLGIEVARMYRPKSHDFVTLALRRTLLQ